MRVLLHAPFNASSRAVRIALGEKKLEANLVEQKSPAEDADFLRINPAGALPVLIEQAPTGDEAVLAPAGAIVEYLDEAYSGPGLLPGTSLLRAEARRLVWWFEERLGAEATSPLLQQKVRNGARRPGTPDFSIVRSATKSAAWHLDYLNHLASQRDWLAGRAFSIADAFAAAHLSCLDYFGALDWRAAPEAKAWYARMKSRPSVRAVLGDRIAGLPPHPGYDDPDF